MFNAKKYLKIRELESILYGGPEASDFNYEKEASFIGDSSSRTRDMLSTNDSIEDVETESKNNDVKDDNTWYVYEYDAEQNQVSFNIECE